MMKKITLFILLLTVHFGFSQAQRFVVIEEFTQASCGPCAGQNPAFNALLSQNTTKCIGLKYQTSFPGADPMNAQNPKDVSDRRSYYPDVTGVPMCKIDGNITPTGPAYDGAPYNVTQANIDNRYNTTSPLEMTLSHTLNNNMDSAFVSLTVKNVSGSTLKSSAAGSLKLHVSLVEEEIIFPNQPGTNGELDFYGVMRELLTGGSGFSLPDSLADQKMETYSYDIALPSYIYSKAEVAFVAFVQENGTSSNPDKEILQGVYSEPVPVSSSAFDAGIENMTPPITDLCATSYTPTIKIINHSTTHTLTSADIYHSVNGGAKVKTAWTGSILPGMSGSHTMNAIPLSGPTTLTFEIDNYNISGDYNSLNNETPDAYIEIINPTPSPAPHQYDVENDAMFSTPAGMLVQGDPYRAFVVDRNINTQVITWDMGGHGKSTKSFRVDNINRTSGSEVSVITEKVSLAGKTNSIVYFDLAYAVDDASSSEKLEVLISKDCGSNWTSLWSEVGSDMATSPPVDADVSFFYPQAWQWARHVLDISAFDGEEVIAMFKVTSGGGNCLYLDNMTINDQIVSIDENDIAAINVYPNPASDVINLEVLTDAIDDYEVVLINSIGQVIMSKSFEAGAIQSLNTSSIQSGIYTLNISVSDEVIKTEKITIIK